MDEKKKKNEQDPLKEELYQQHTANFFNNPAVKIVIGAGVLFGVLYVSKYFINVSADTVRACKNLRKAWKEC